MEKNKTKDNTFEQSKFTTNPKHGERLYKFMHRDSHVKIKIQELAEAIGKSRGAINRLLLKDVFTKSDILLLNFCTDLNINNFIADLDTNEVAEEYGSFEIPLTIKSNQGHSANTLYRNFKKSAKDDEKLKQYFGIIKSKVNGCNRILSVYDYLGWKTSAKLQKNDLFLNEATQYMRSIEALATGNKGLEYRRVLALPLRFEEYDKILSHFQFSENDKEVLYSASAIRLIFNYSFEHILKSFKAFGDRFSLYLLGKTEEKYSYMTIDSKAVLIQTSTYDPKSSRTELDNLFIHTHTAEYPDEDIERMITSYNRKFLLLEGFSSERDFIFKVNLDALNAYGFNYNTMLKEKITEWKIELDVAVGKKLIELNGLIATFNEELERFSEKIEILSNFSKE